MAVDRAELSAFDSVQAIVNVLDDDDDFRCRSVEIDERAGGYLVRFVEGGAPLKPRSVVLDLGGKAAAWLVETLGRRLAEHDADAIEFDDD